MTDTLPGVDGGPEHRIDEPPTVRKTRGRPRKATGTTKKAASSASPNATGVRAQFELAYNLAGQAVAPRLPYTGGAIQQQAPTCAAAWDQFLKRWPALYDAIEKGMIGADVIALLMAHMPILQAARMEMAARAEAQRSTDYNPDANASSVA